MLSAELAPARQVRSPSTVIARCGLYDIVDRALGVRTTRGAASSGSH